MSLRSTFQHTGSFNQARGYTHRRSCKQRLLNTAAAQLYFIFKAVLASRIRAAKLERLVAYLNTSDHVVSIQLKVKYSLSEFKWLLLALIEDRARPIIIRQYYRDGISKKFSSLVETKKRSYQYFKLNIN